MKFKQFYILRMGLLDSIKGLFGKKEPVPESAEQGSAMPTPQQPPAGSQGPASGSTGQTPTPDQPQG